MKISNKKFKKIIAKKRTLQLRGWQVTWYPSRSAIPRGTTDAIREFGEAGVLACWKEDLGAGTTD